MMHLPQRNTQQRQVILEELQRITSHPTAVGLYMIVRRRLPKISLGTVYRNLDLLVRTGLIQKLEFAGSEARFDGNVQRHDHLRCIQCGRIDDVSTPPLDLLEGMVKDWDGYQILGHRLEFFGICSQCRCRHGDAAYRCDDSSVDASAMPAARSPELAKQLST